MSSNAGIIKKLTEKSSGKKIYLLANQKIKVGDVLGAAVGPIVAKSRSKHAIMVDNSNSSGQGRRPKIITQNKFKHISHSETPNVTCQNGIFIALKTIYPKTRISMDFNG